MKEAPVILPDEQGEGISCYSEHYVLVLVEAFKWVPYLRAGVKNNHPRYHVIAVSQLANEYLQSESEKQSPMLSTILMECEHRPLGIRLSTEAGNWGPEHLGNLLRHFTEKLEEWSENRVIVQFA